DVAPRASACSPRLRACRAVTNSNAPRASSSPADRSVSSIDAALETGDAAVAVFTTFRSGLPGGLGGLSGFLTLLQPRDHRVDALLLDLRTEVFAIALDVADAIDVDVISLPAVRRHMQCVIHRNAITVVALDLRSHGGMVVIRGDPRGENLEPISRE